MGLDFAIFRRKCSGFKKEVGLNFAILASILLAHSRVAVSVGSVGSAVCFFVLILNNAPALRAGKNHFLRIQQLSLRNLRKFQNLGYFDISRKIAEIPEHFQQN